MLLVCITAICLRSVLRCIYIYIYIYIYLSSGQYVYVGKDGRIRGCFSKPNGVREQKRLGNTDIDIIMV